MTCNIVCGYPLSLHHSRDVHMWSKRPLVIKTTDKGWISHSNEPGWTNEYVNGETWDEVMKWLHKDMFHIQVFSCHEEWQDNLRSMMHYQDGSTKISKYYRKHGLFPDEEVENFLKYMKVDAGPPRPVNDDEMAEP
jgi:hypothetical protein